MNGITSPHLRILLVEDDAVHAKIVRRAMREFSDRLTINHVTDGRGAVKAVTRGGGAGRERPFDLILLDLRLPCIDGFEVLSTIRSHRVMRGVPVVVVSTSDRPEEIERCYELGANAYMCKPVRFDEMLRHLRALASFWIHATSLQAARRQPA